MILVGATRREQNRLEAILYPSASIARYHEVVNVLTKDGTVFSGLLVRETVREMFLASAEGIVESIPYQDIKQARYSNASLMHERLDQLLEPEETADLVTYLKTLKRRNGTLEVTK